MSHPRWFGACLLGVLMWSGARADEPTGPSRHVRLPGPADPDPDRSLTERLAGLKQFQGLRAKHPDVLTDEQLKKLAQFARDNPDKLGDPKEIEKLIGSLLGKQLSEEDQKLVRKFVEQAVERERPGTIPPEPSPSVPPPPEEDPTAVQPPPSTAPTTPEAEEAKSQEELTRELLQFVKQFDGLGESMPDSPAMQQLVQELGNFKLDNRGSDPSGADAASLERMLKALGSVGKWFAGDETTNVRDLPAPPRWRHLPPSSSQMPNFSPSVGQLSTPVGAAPGSQSLTVLAVVAVLGVVLAWWFRNLWSGLVGPDAEGWRLGPWPVEPSRIASRQDLVRAFEYLTLLRFGAAARAWNHRSVAAKFSEAGWEEHRAAQRLAEAYERARYAPEESVVDEAVLTTARADLCFLAGMARA